MAGVVATFANAPVKPVTTFSNVAQKPVATFSGNAGLQGSSPTNLGGSAPALQQTVTPKLTNTASTVTTLGNAVPTPPAQVNPFGQSLTGSVPSTANPGPAPSFRQVSSDGTIFTDPNALAQHEVELANNKTYNYNGQTGLSKNDYTNQVLGAAQKQHDDAIKQINTAHGNGLISFDQQQQLIDQSRQSLKDQLSSTIGAQHGYANQISPDATQSQVGVLDNAANTQYQTGVGQIDNQQTNLGTAKSGFEDQYANSLQGADQGLNSTKDQLANNADAFAAGNQSTLNAGTTAAINLQNQVASYNASAANAAQPTVTQFDPGTTASDAANYVKSQSAIGVPIDTALKAYANSVASKGVNVNSPQYQGIQNYVYGLFVDPKTKVPIPGSGYVNPPS